MTGALRAAGAAEPFTADERARLAPYFTDLDGHIFALTNLPETVKGALFARYSRSGKSLRRLFLDEFADKVGPDSETPQGRPSGGAAVERAERLYARVFSDYGDDSVAQLGGAHIACESVSNVLTKVLEWGRLMSYLEQSTRYVPYTDRRHDRWRYHVPAEIGGGALHDRYVRTMDAAFACYAEWIPRMQAYFEARHPRGPADSEAVHRAAIRAKALDTLRGLLPAATQSNVGSLRQRAGVRVAAAADARPPAARGPRVRRRHAPRAAEGDSGVPDPGRSARPRRPLVRVPGVHARRGRRGGHGAAGRRRRRGARRGHACATSIRTARSKSSPPLSTHRPRCPTIS